MNPGMPAVQLKSRGSFASAAPSSGQDVFKLNEKFFNAYYGKGAAPMLEPID